MPKSFLDESALSPPILRGGAMESHAISSILKEMPPAVRKEMRTSTAAYLTGESGHFEALNPTTGFKVALDYPHQARDDAILAEFEAAYRGWMVERIAEGMSMEAWTESVHDRIGAMLDRHGVPRNSDQWVRVSMRISRRTTELIGARQKTIAEERDVHQIALEYSTWVGVEFRMGKPDGSGLHKLAEALIANKVRVPQDGGTSARIFTKALNSLKLPDCHSVVLEHDWAGAFRKAEDIAGEWEPPYPATAFEYGINGRRIIMLFEKDEGAASSAAAIFLHLPMCWVLLTGFDLKADNTIVLASDTGPQDHPLLMELASLCVAQARFASIALDAKVAETEVIRAPHRLNRAREKAGKLPLYDYHVINLARRTRPSRLEPIEGGLETEKRNSPRLHFRRQHWRYFANHCTRIPWTLAGDPDLGFIEKHYRL